MKKIIIALIVLVVLGAAGWFAYTRLAAGSAAPEEAMLFETAALEKGSLTATIDALGKVRSGQSAELKWETSGTVEEVLVSAGQQVRKGDVLARLVETSLPEEVILAQADLTKAEQELEDLRLNADTSSIEAMQDIVTYEQAVRDAQYALDNFTIPTSQAGLSAVEAIAKTKKRLEAARLRFEPLKFDPVSDPLRQDALLELNLAQSEYNSAVKRLKYEYDLTVAQANLDKAVSDFEKFKSGPNAADIEEVQARIAAAQAAISQRLITAPFDGTVTKVIPQVGDVVAINASAFRLDDLTRLFVDLEVSEIDINQVQPGQPADIAIDALPGKNYPGKVESVSMVGSAEGEAVYFTVTVQFTEPDAQVLPGMTSEVKIVVAELSDVLLVPNQAIRLENGTPVVYVMRPEQGPMPVPAEVTLGMSTETFTQLLSGELQPGDVVVLNPTDTVTTDSPRMFFRPGGGGGGNRQPNP